jgi:hypothetical protein
MINCSGNQISRLSSEAKAKAVAVRIFVHYLVAVLILTIYGGQV